jgi:hypothetical protein
LLSLRKRVFIKRYATEFTEEEEKRKRGTTDYTDEHRLRK